MHPRFLRRTDVLPLRKDVPVDAIAEWLAREIQRIGHLTHDDTQIDLLVEFGGISTYCFYNEPVRDKRGKVIRNRLLLHPEILQALKKLTGKKVVWGKECGEWWARGVGEAARREMILAKSVRARAPSRSSA